MDISYGPRAGDSVVADFLFEGRPMPAFAAKIEAFCQGIQDRFEWLQGIELTISSSNSFPHSSGIASSASSMSALALCLVDIDCQLSGASLDVGSEQIHLVSDLARLGSGSASRSVYPHLAAWGDHPDMESSNQWATPVVDVHEVFKTYHDDICIVSDREKSVSSTAGHQLMEDNPYATARYAQAQARITDLLGILSRGDVVAFGELAESEAMALHGMMMCSQPSYMLIETGTIEMIRAIHAYRLSTGIPVYYSLDAGPNIHLLYPHEVADLVATWRDEVLKPMCVGGRIIADQVGFGPERLP
jgi:diphosphomevalonate decarboxylase